jgi:hypothetical protein
LFIDHGYRTIRAGQGLTQANAEAPAFADQVARLSNTDLKMPWLRLWMWERIYEWFGSKVIPRARLLPALDFSIVCGRND